MQEPCQDLLRADILQLCVTFQLLLRSQKPRSRPARSNRLVFIPRRSGDGTKLLKRRMCQKCLTDGFYGARW